MGFILRKTFYNWRINQLLMLTRDSDAMQHIIIFVLRLRRTLPKREGEKKGKLFSVAVGLNLLTPV